VQPVPGANFEELHGSNVPRHRCVHQSGYSSGVKMEKEFGSAKESHEKNIMICDIEPYQKNDSFLTRAILNLRYFIMINVGYIIRGSR